MPRIPRQPLGLIRLVAVSLVIVQVIPRPASISPEGWCPFAIFTAPVVGMIQQPIAGGALVLMAIFASTLRGGLTLSQALAAQMAAKTSSVSMDWFRWFQAGLVPGAVASRQTLGVARSFFGEVWEEVKASAAGVVLSMTNVSPVKAGESAVTIARPQQAPKK